jgi:hypothetical protein
VAGLALEDLPASHRDGGYILGVLRVLDLAEALGLMAPRPVAVVNMGKISNKHWARRAYDRLGQGQRLLYLGCSLQRALDHASAPSA